MEALFIQSVRAPSQRFFAGARFLAFMLSETPTPFAPRSYRRPVKSKMTTTMAMTPMTPISTVTVAVSIAAELATEAAEKEDHEKDEEDQTN